MENKIKQKWLVEICNLNTKFTASAKKPELKAEQDKIVKLQTYDLEYFLGKNVFGGHGF